MIYHVEDPQEHISIHAQSIHRWGINRYGTDQPAVFTKCYGFSTRRINSLWPGDTAWRHGTRSTLAQVMACCLTAPSHYLNQCWLIISKVLHERAISWEDPKIPTSKTRLKITFLESHSDLSRANELKQQFLFLRSYWGKYLTFSRFGLDLADGGTGQ